MKFKSWTAGIAVLTLATAPAFAEDSMAQWSNDQMVIPVGCDSGCDSGCDCGDGCGVGCGSGCGGAGAGLLSGMGPGYVEGFSIGSALGLDGLDLGGWTQVGATTEPTLLASLRDFDGDPTTSARDGGSFNNIEDRWNLHQQYFYIGKEADGSNGLGFGFRADFIYGIDGPDTQSFGNPDGSFDYDNGDDTDGFASDFTRGDGS